MKILLLVLTALLAPGALAQSLPSESAPAQASAGLEGDSIWPRLVRGMRLGGEERPEVQRFIAHYRANPAFFSVMLSRAEPFLWFILEATEARRLPTELALLPAVESSWNPHAVSVSSAYGLWQFIPKTGQAYGLRDALNYDARRDPVASTTAAMLLLDELHDEYRSWPLALAAYNTGGVRLKQAMKASNSRNFWQLPLPPVTRDYVPRLLAIAALVRNPARHGLSLPHISALPTAELVALDHRMPLPSALAAARVDPAVLRIFNPGLHRADAPTQSPTLLLPRSDALALRAELAALQQDAATLNAAHQPNTTDEPAVEHSSAAMTQRAAPFSQRLHWAVQMGSAAPVRTQATLGVQRSQHRVRPGDTLFGIAREHGLDVARLKRLNPAARSSPLKVNQLINLVGCTGSTCS